MCASAVDLFCAGIFQGLHSTGKCSCSIDQIVNDENIFSFDLTDDIHDFYLIRSRPALVDQHEIGIQPLCVRSRHLNSSHIGGDHRQSSNFFPSVVIDKNHGRI